MEPDEGLTDESDELAVDIHLRDGTVISTVVTEADTGDRTTDEYLEAAIADGPRFVWIGQAYVHNRAISGIAYVDRDEIAFPA